MTPLSDRYAQHSQGWCPPSDWLSWPRTRPIGSCGVSKKGAHTLGVGRQARRISRELRLPGSDADLFEAAALLHDVGYAHVLHGTGFHPIDGANYAFAITGNRALAGLIAHHSHGWVEARLRGLARAMHRFEEPEPMLADALTYCDMTVGPQGQPMSPGQRLADVHDRYEPGHVVARAVAELLDRLGVDPGPVKASSGTSMFHANTATRR